MRHEGCESHFGTGRRKLYGLPPYYYYQRHALRFHAHVRVTLYVIFSVGVPSIARSVTSDAERAHVLWNAAYVASSRILRHKGPKYGVHLDSDGWASISRGGRKRCATVVSCCREIETHMSGGASPMKPLFDTYKQGRTGRERERERERDMDRTLGTAYTPG